MAGKDIITMTQEELKRLHIVRKALEKKLKQVEAAEKLDLSYRQIKRIIKRVREQGDTGVIHKLRGRPSSNKIPNRIKEKAIALCRGKYKGFGPTLAVEKLFELEKIKISDETLRNWLSKEGLWQRVRKRKKHRQWRERRHHFGEMIQLDGSDHDWFEGRGPECVLMGYIDDATSNKFGQFYEYEGTIPAFDSLKQYMKKHGIPHSIYLDRHSTYKSTAKPTIDDELSNREHLSQLERAAKELGINIIHANSAPAKGRVERSFRTDQDRLVKEIRLERISTIKEANKFLKSYWPKHNKRFSVKPIKEGNLHRPLPQDMDLDLILCKRTEHPLRNDFTIAHDKGLYQILDRAAGRKVTVEERISGAMYITYKGKKLRYKAIPVRPKIDKPKAEPKGVYRPPMEHPFKGPMFRARYPQINTYSQKEKVAQKEKELLLV